MFPRDAAAIFGLQKFRKNNLKWVTICHSEDKTFQPISQRTDKCRIRLLATKHPQMDFGLTRDFLLIAQALGLPELGRVGMGNESLPKIASGVALSCRESAAATLCPQVFVITHSLSRMTMIV